MAMPDITSLADDELRRLLDVAGAELNRRNRLAEAPAMVADILCRARDDGGDLAKVAASGQQLAEERSAGQNNDSTATR